jgi:transcriptional regulator with XRE-family HTH domain
LTLGERIYNQRTAHNLTQSDLADALEVSRQSVSKWETDASVPDLDKLVKMSELFGISLDYMVRGMETTAEQVKPTVVTQQEKSPLTIQTILGLILIIFGLVFFMIIVFVQRWGLDDAAVYCVPLLLWGTLCLRCKKHPVLACLWGTWGMYTLILVPFLVAYGFSSPAVNVFIPPNLLLLGVLSITTWWVIKQS